jgi:hypothetical protein
MSNKQIFPATDKKKRELHWSIAPWLYDHDEPIKL